MLGIWTRPVLVSAPPGWLSGERVGLMTWWLCVRVSIEAKYLFSAYFHLSPLLKLVRKVVGGFGKKFVLVLV